MLQKIIEHGDKIMVTSKTLIRTLRMKDYYGRLYMRYTFLIYEHDGRSWTWNNSYYPERHD